MGRGVTMIRELNLTIRVTTSNSHSMLEEAERRKEKKTNQRQTMLLQSHPNLELKESGRGREHQCIQQCSGRFQCGEGEWGTSDLSVAHPLPQCECIHILLALRLKVSVSLFKKNKSSNIPMVDTIVT